MALQFFKLALSDSIIQPSKQARTDTMGFERLLTRIGEATSSVATRVGRSKSTTSQEYEELNTGTLAKRLRMAQTALDKENDVETSTSMADNVKGSDANSSSSSSSTTTEAKPIIHAPPDEFDRMIDFMMASAADFLRFAQERLESTQKK